jgi:hypothetical protein
MATSISPAICEPVSGKLTYPGGLSEAAQISIRSGDETGQTGSLSARESTPVLVPVFSPSFFAGHNCGQEVQAFLERIRVYASNNPPPAVPPNCILR